MLKKLLLILGGLLIVLLAAAAAGYYYLLGSPLPQIDGSLRAPGLTRPVTVIRDRWGVPHLYAENVHDLCFAQGWVQAQDRLWQMEMNRRLAAGRLSEIVGEKALPLDRVLRTLGLMRAAEQEVRIASPDDLAALQAFADGVNAHNAARASKLPVEFRLLGLRPEPWIPAHSLGWAKTMALFGGKNWQEEIVRALLVEKLGAEKTAGLLARYRPGTPTVVPPGLEQVASMVAALSPSATPEPGFLTLPGGASNNWAVHGSRTAAGSPLLANDMHLQLAIPSVWYEMHLSGGGFDVAGLTLPGVPLVIAGHNRDLAWGITFAYVDVQDVYLEKMNPDRPGEYLFENQWRQAELVREEIRVKGLDKPVVHETWWTVHGPVISPLSAEFKGLEHSLALKWSAHDPGGIVAALRRINLSTNWDEFRSAAGDWAEPAMNLAYADRRGNIGYVLASRVPVRASGHGLGPLPGWTGEYEWTGYLPPESKPAFLNPDKGFLATANNRLAGPDYPYYLGADFAPGHRQARILEFLADKDKCTAADCRDLQADLKCLPAAQFIEALNRLKLDTPAARRLLPVLNSWNRVLDPDSAGGAVYAVLFERLLENTFSDEMGSLTGLFLGCGLVPLFPLNGFVFHARVILLDLMSEPDAPWFDDAATAEKETLAEIAARSLEQTAAVLDERMGRDPAGWRWGLIHRVRVQHPLGQVKPLDRLFNLGPFPGGGHFSTVWQSAVTPGPDYDLSAWTASNRHIYDLGDWDASLAAIAPGQSGMVGSPHYGDQMPNWLDVAHHPLLFSRDKIEAAAEGRLVLEP